MIGASSLDQVLRRRESALVGALGRILAVRLAGLLLVALLVVVLRVGALLLLVGLRLAFTILVARGVLVGFLVGVVGHFDFLVVGGWAGVIAGPVTQAEAASRVP